MWVWVFFFPEDKRRDGNRGRCLSTCIAEAGLRTGDRLEPSSNLRDIGRGFDNLQNFPVAITFWRRKSESLARHRNPLFDLSLGVTFPTTVTVDLMHTIHLGVMNVFCKHIVWELFVGGAWCRMHTLDETVTANILQCEREFKSWANRYKREHVDAKMNTFRLSRKVVGENAARKLALKAAQTWYFLLFMIDVLERVQHTVDGAQSYLTAAKSLARFVNVFQSSKLNMPIRDPQQAWDAWLQFCALTEDYVSLPKRHLTMHLLHGLPWFGNAAAYANWADESANLVFKKCCRQISQRIFETVVLQQMRAIFRPRGAKRFLGEQ